MTVRYRLCLAIAVAVDGFWPVVAALAIVAVFLCMLKFGGMFEWPQIVIGR